jgi:RHS repeat-associated protein
LTRYSDLAGHNTVGSSGYSFDQADRVTNIQNKGPTGTVLANYTYAWDAASRLTQKTENGTATTYAYDAGSELTGAGGTAYSYDANGNRNSSGYATTAGNEMTNDGTWTYTYDNNGNEIQKAQGGSTGVTWAFTYNNLNQMTSAKETTNSSGATLVLATYVYDVYANRIEEDVYQNGSTTLTRYGYDGTNLWAALTSGNALQTWYISGDEVDQVFARVSGAGTAAWYLTDYQGSVRSLTDAAGTLQDTIAYDAYGRVTSESNTSFGDMLKYAGGQEDSATGLVEFGWRYYDPYRGAWTSQDPRAFSAGDTNLYRYVGNSSVLFIDPSGLWKVKRQGGGRATATAAISRPGENQETIESLGLTVGLNPSEFRAWLRSADGQISIWRGEKWVTVALSDKSLKITDIVEDGQKLSVPNTVFALWVGDWGDHGKKLVGWDKDLDKLNQWGYKVVSDSYFKGAKPKWHNPTPEGWLKEVGRSSNLAELQGIFVTGHGCASSFGTQKSEFAVSYSELADVLKYKLGFVILNCCDSGWSKNDKNVGGVKGATIDAGGMDIISSAAKYWVKKGTLVPVTGTGHPNTIMGPGSQGSARQTLTKPRVALGGSTCRGCSAGWSW